MADTTANRADCLLSRGDTVDPSKGMTFGYDLNGNQTSRTGASGTWTMGWDARNTLTSVKDGAGTPIGSYDYDRNNIRIRRKTQAENVEYVLDGRHVLQELDASQAGEPQIRRYHYGTKVLAVTESAGTSYVLNDGLGSASDFWNSGGMLAKSRQYDAWGGYRNGTAPGSGEAKIGYTGHQFDPETGWIKVGVRYYDPVLGIFLSRDSYQGDIGDAPSLHRYAYARRNPLRYGDPSGNSATVIGGVAGFFWGFGQMMGTGINDVYNAVTDQGISRRDVGDYLSIWGQNIVGGAEIGASFDAAVLSGGTGALVSGALGNAGLGALTFGGQAKDWSTFAGRQGEDALKGAVAGAVLSKALPILGEVAGKIPGVAGAAEKVVAAAGDVAKAIGDRYVATEADKVLGVMPNPFAAAQDALKQAGDALKSLTAPEADAAGAGGLRMQLPEVPDAVAPEALQSAKMDFDGMGGASAAEGAAARTFTSADPLVGDLATKIEAAYPGHVTGVNVPMFNSAGQLVTDVDIMLQNAVIQVKAGSGAGLTSQLARTQAVTALPVIGYGPKLGGTLMQNIGKAGGLVTRDEKLLIEVVKP